MHLGNIMKLNKFYRKMLGPSKMTQFCAMCQVVTSEGVSPITIRHIFTSHNLPRDELWYKIVPFLMVLAQLNSIRQ